MCSALFSVLCLVVGLNFSVAPAGEPPRRWDDPRTERKENAVPDELSGIEPGEMSAQVRRVDFMELLKFSQFITRESAEIESHARGLVHGRWQRLVRIPAACFLDSRSLPLEI